MGLTRIPIMEQWARDRKIPISIFLASAFFQRAGSRSASAMRSIVTLAIPLVENCCCDFLDYKRLFRWFASVVIAALSDKQGLIIALSCDLIDKAVFQSNTPGPPARPVSF